MMNNIINEYKIYKIVTIVTYYILQVVRHLYNIRYATFTSFKSNFYIQNYLKHKIKTTRGTSFQGVKWNVVEQSRRSGILLFLYLVLPKNLLQHY